MNRGSITLRKATHEDIQNILTLLSAREVHDFQSLISVPGQFQHQLLRLDVGKGRFFVAVNEKDGSVVAQRRVFVIEDQNELHKILSQLLRCTQAQRELIEHGFFDRKHEFFQGEVKHFTPHQKILYLYIGSAFTHPAYRGRRINERLNAHAYDQLKDVIAHKIRTHSYTSLALVYGTIDENHWITIPIVRQFFPFARSLSAAFNWPPAEKVSFYAYKLYKPEFTVSPEGELVQLPDEQCRPGRGCVLLYDL